MAGLVGYASSDDDDSDYQDHQVQQPKQINEEKTNKNVDISTTEKPECAAPPKSSQSREVDEPAGSAKPDTKLAETAGVANDASSGQAAEEPEPEPQQEEALPAVVMIGPSRPPPQSEGLSGSLPSMDDLEDEQTDIGPPPLSPYSAEKARLRELTLPRVPDFDIPGSPPGTPPPGLDTLTKKYDTFLDLKSKKGTHFNARLAQSSAVQSPALMDKLMAFIGLDADPKEDEGWSRRNNKAQDVGGSSRSTFSSQYGTTLSKDIWCPSAFPQGAYRIELRRFQDEMAKQQARAPGEKMEFVPASEDTRNSIRGHRNNEKADAGRGTAKRKTRFD